jgi:hypothetical protein
VVQAVALRERARLVALSGWDLWDADLLMTDYMISGNNVCITMTCLADSPHSCQNTTINADQGLYRHRL